MKCKRCGNSADGDHMLRVSTAAIFGHIEIEEVLCEECANAYLQRTREWCGLPAQVGRKRK